MPPCYINDGDRNDMRRIMVTEGKIVDAQSRTRHRFDIKYSLFTALDGGQTNR